MWNAFVTIVNWFNVIFSSQGGAEKCNYYFAIRNWPWLGNANSDNIWNLDFKNRYWDKSGKSECLTFRKTNISTDSQFTWKKCMFWYNINQIKLNKNNNFKNESHASAESFHGRKLLTMFAYEEKVVLLFVSTYAFWVHIYNFKNYINTSPTCFAVKKPFKFFPPTATTKLVRII